jgi:hypothetical protein
MSPRIVRISKLLGIPLTSPQWKKGDAWFECPATFEMLNRIANVMEYVDAEFGIRNEMERKHLHEYLHDLHSAFSNRLASGEELHSIGYPADVLDDHEFSFKSRIPSGVLVEKLREQFGS